MVGNGPLPEGRYTFSASTTVSRIGVNIATNLGAFSRRAFISAVISCAAGAGACAQHMVATAAKDIATRRVNFNIAEISFIEAAIPVAAQTIPYDCISKAAKTVGERR